MEVLGQKTGQQGAQENTGSWRNTVEHVRRSGAMWEPFLRLDAAEILAWHNVQPEIAALKAIGVRSAWEMVLRRGPRACRHARTKAERQGVPEGARAPLVVNLILGKR